MTKGKCISDKIAIEWRGKPLLRDACCPICRKHLEPTVYYLGSGKNKAGWRWITGRVPFDSNKMIHTVEGIKTPAEYKKWIKR